MTADPHSLIGWGVDEMDEVERVIRHVNDTVILASFDQLSEADVTEKFPGEVVTVTDRRAEEVLRNKLTRLVPGSVMVGEESVGQDPTLLRHLGRADPVWIIDPIDGTENFIAHGRQFSTLVALAYRGELLASWLSAPLMGITAMALVGKGASVNGRPVQVGRLRPQRFELTVAMSGQRWWGPQTRAWHRSLRRAGVRPSSFETAGLGYLELMRGRTHALVLQWEHVWDHAAGMLLLTEAGGAVTGADGRPFQLGGGTLPMVAAVSPATARRVHQILRTTSP